MGNDGQDSPPGPIGRQRKERRRRRQQNDLVETFGVLEGVLGGEPAAVGQSRQVDPFPQVKGREHMVEPCNEIVRRAEGLLVDAETAVIDVIEGVHPELL
jgi:hypothetical protein